MAQSRTRQNKATVTPAPTGVKSSTVRTATSRVQSAVRSQRLWEIDALRGTAAITMAIYHFGWDMVSFGLASFNPYAGFWYWLQRYTCITFIGLSGVSLTLVDRRLEEKGMGRRDRFIYIAKRGLWVLMWGVIISVVMSAIGFPIHFGVLHLIGVATILAIPILRLPWVALGGWVVLFVLGRYMPTWNVDTLWLVWLGLMPNGYYAVDYFPLVPWFGVTLLGVFAGNMLYPAARRLFVLPDYGDWAPVRGLRWLGSHSLPFYLLHQPILFGAVYLWAMIRY